MERILTIVLLFCCFVCKAQIINFNDSLIADILHKETIKIGQKILNAASEGKIKVYKNDSLNDFLLLSDLNKKIQSQRYFILSAIYKPNSAIHNPKKAMDLITFVSLLKMGNKEFPAQLLFFIKISDAEKVISENDKKLLIILSNLLFDTNNIELEINTTGNEKMQSQDINNFITDVISDNIGGYGFKVIFSRENSRIIGTAFIQHINLEFKKTITDKLGSNQNFQNIYEDINVTRLYNAKSWKKKTDFCETVTIQDVSNPDLTFDSTICTPIDWLAFDKVVITATAIGLQYNEPAKFGGRQIQVFTKKMHPNIELTDWQKFIIENYLL